MKNSNLKRKMPTIGIDVDITCVDTVFCEGGWYDYLNNMSRNKLSKEYLKSLPELEYNLNLHYPDLTEEEAMSFWNDGKLYQRLKPREDAVKAIYELYCLGYHIVFISHCTGGHYESKVQAAKEWFLPFQIPKERFAFVSTDRKDMVDVDVMIDDRNSFINLFENKPEVVKIKIASNYTQEEPLRVSIDLETDCWDEILEFIEELF